MRERVLALRADIIGDLRSIEQIFDRLGHHQDTVADDEQAIIVGYYLHTLYNAFESIFQQVAEAFENDIADRSQWHALLLKRMALDIEGIRPRLLSDESYKFLNEMRQFRHLFRSMYSSDLDIERVNLVLNRARRLETCYPPDIERFLAYLDDLG